MEGRIRRSEDRVNCDRIDRYRSLYTPNLCISWSESVSFAKGRGKGRGEDKRPLFAPTRYYISRANHRCDPLPPVFRFFISPLCSSLSLPLSFEARIFLLSFLLFLPFPLLFPRYNALSALTLDDSGISIFPTSDPMKF